MNPGFFRPVLLSLTSLLFLAACTCSAPKAVRGTLNGEIRWQGTIEISGDVIVERGSHLVIAPGTTILFLPPSPGEDRLVDHPHFPGSELIVRGAVTAEGTRRAPIVFRHSDPAAPAGSWGGINLQQSPSARFRYCRFVQADSALHSQESEVVVRESVFEKNLVALRFHTSNILFEHNLVRGNGTGVRFHFGSPVIRWNEIRENDRGFFITSHPREFVIENNSIVANREFSVVLGEEVPGTIPMKGNWWGERDPERIAESFFDGQREDYLGKIDFIPLAPEPIPGAGISWRP